MLFTDETQFAKHVKLAIFDRVYFLYGEEGYLVRKYAQRMTRAVLDGANEDFNLHILSGKDTSVQQIADAVSALPFFAPKKCVLVQDYDPDAAGAKDKDQMKELLDDPPGACVLIFTLSAPGLLKSKSAKLKSFLSLVGKVGSVVQLGTRDERQLCRFIAGEVSKRHIAVDNETCAYLVSRVGTDMAALRNETDKLCAYVQTGELTKEHIDLVCARYVDASVYDLSRFLLAGDYQRAMHRLDELFYMRETPVGILAALSSNFVDVYRAGVFRRAGIPAEKLADYFPYKGRAFVIRNAFRDSARHSVEALRACVRILADTDAALKSTNVDKRFLLEQAFARITMALSKPKSYEKTPFRTGMNDGRTDNC